MLGCVDMETDINHEVNLNRYFEINGVQQFVSIKGVKKSNPILLILHGGPGDTSLPMVRKYNKPLEKVFNVACWEQRGAGKSYYRFDAAKPPKISDFVQDAKVLCEILLKYFGQTKLFISAHSWGSVLGIHLLMECPHIIQAYVGCGQVVHMKKITMASYKFALDKSRENNDANVTRRLVDIDWTYTQKNWYKDLLFVTRQVVKYGGSLYGQSNYSKFVKDFMTSKDYTMTDILRRQKGSAQSIKYLWPELMNTNFEDKTSFDVPVIFIEGMHDYHASYKVVEEYYQTITSDKRLYLFEKSAHFPQWSEYDKYNQILSEMANAIKEKA